MTNWDDLRTVLAVVRGASLAGAAAELGVNYTTVARRIARAEAAMGVTLFERLTDGYSPTETGRLVAEHAARMEDSENAMMRHLSGRDVTLSGTLTITAPQLLIAYFLAPVLDDFCEAHPDVSLRVLASNELLDLNRREADLAIRISRNPGDTLTGLRLTPQHSASFAAPAWAERLADGHAGPIDWIIYDQQQDVPRAAAERYPASRVKLRLDDMVAMLGAAQAGLGLVRAPMFLGRAAPGLVQVPVLPPEPYADIWVVAHPDVWPSAKLAAFRNVMVPYFKRNRGQFVAQQNNRRSLELDCR